MGLAEVSFHGSTWEEGWERSAGARREGYFCQAVSRTHFSRARLFPLLPKPWSGKEPSRLCLISLKMLILALPLHIHEPVVSFRCRGQ